MITFEKVMRLRAVDLFRQMKANELARVASISHEVVVGAGQTIFSQGDFGDRLFVIVEGEVEIRHDGRVVNTLKETDYFGEMSILDGEPRFASAIATRDCLLLEIRQEDFKQMLTRHADTALAVIGTLMRRLRSAS